MDSTSKKHVLLLPFPAFGHALPLTELARRISNHHNVTVAVSCSFLKEMKQRDHIHLPDVNYLEIHDVFAWKKDFTKSEFLAMFDLIFNGVAKLLSTIPIAGKDHPTAVDIVIGDNLLSEALSVCHERQLPYYLFNSAQSHMTLQALVTDENYPAILSSDESTGSGQQYLDYPPVPGDAPKPIPEWYKRIMLAGNKHMKEVSGVVFNSIYDFEEDTLREIKKFPVMDEIPLFCLGPLSPEALDPPKEVQVWLDRQPVSSVVYISFGSICGMKPEQIVEIGDALLDLDGPFIWVLDQELFEHLPEEISSKTETQFEEEHSKFLVLNWSPQEWILKHSAISVFISHCGWNSLLESCVAGVPVVCWPLSSDQKISAQWLTDRSAGLMIEDTGVLSKKVVSADEIVTAVKTVGFEGILGGTVFRHAAHALKVKVEMATAPGGSADAAFQEFIEFNQAKTQKMSLG